jgi:hypothetical protein
MRDGGIDEKIFFGLGAEVGIPHPIPLPRGEGESARRCKEFLWHWLK